MPLSLVSSVSVCRLLAGPDHSDSLMILLGYIGRCEQAANLPDDVIEGGLQQIVASRYFCRACMERFGFHHDGGQVTPPGQGMLIHMPG